MDRLFDGKLVVSERAVGLADFDDVFSGCEQVHFAVEQVAGVLQGDLVEVAAVDAVDGLGKGHIVRHREAQNWEADLAAAVEIQAWGVQVGFVVGVPILPGEVWVHDHHGVATGRFCGADGPGVGAYAACNSAASGGRLGDAGHAREVAEVDDTVEVPDHVRAADGEGAFAFLIESIGVAAGVFVEAVGEGVQVAAELRGLLVVPVEATFGDAVEVDPLVGVEEFVAPVFAGASSGFAVELEDEVAVGLHLGVAVAEEEPFSRLGVYVRDAVGVPEDFGFGWRGEQGRGCGEEEQGAGAHCE